MATKHQLAQLIDSVKDANGWSDTQLARNAKGQGHVISKSNISRYRDPLVSIKGEAIFALAAALRVMPSQVAVAAIESMGIALPSYDVPTPEQSVRLDAYLSDRDKKSVLALLRELRSSQSDAQAQSDQSEEVKSFDESQARHLDSVFLATVSEIEDGDDCGKKSRRPHDRPGA